MPSGWVEGSRAGKHPLIRMCTQKVLMECLAVGGVTICSGYLAPDSHRSFPPRSTKLQPCPAAGPQRTAQPMR